MSRKFIRYPVQSSSEVQMYKDNLDEMHEIQDRVRQLYKSDVLDDPRFDVYQMREIEKGLKSGVDVGWYATPQFDRHQMKCIRYGLENGLDVSQYAYPNFTSWQMNNIIDELEFAEEDINHG